MYICIYVVIFYQIVEIKESSALAHYVDTLLRVYCARGFVSAKYTVMETRHVEKGSVLLMRFSDKIHCV